MELESLDDVEGEIADHLESEGVEIHVLHVNHHGANNGSEAASLRRSGRRWA